MTGKCEKVRQENGPKRIRELRCEYVMGGDISVRYRRLPADYFNITVA